jgi:hypothetical protein
MDSKPLESTARGVSRARAVALAAAGFGLAPPAIAAALDVQVLGAGAPVANATVTLWQAGSGAPRQLAQARSGADGGFALAAPDAPLSEGSLVLVARGGTPAAGKGSGDNPAIALMTVVGAKAPARVTINELTTIASLFTHAQFIDGSAIKGAQKPRVERSAICSQGELRARPSSRRGWDAIGAAQSG